MDRHAFGEFVRRRLENGHWSALGGVAREGMNDRESPIGGWAFDSRESGYRDGAKLPRLLVIEVDGMSGPGWKRGQELKR